MTKRYTIAFLSCLFLLAGCDLIDYHPYDVRVKGETDYLPWSFNLGKGFSTEPLSCGMYFNTVFGNEFWVHEPDRYPKGYYGFSSKLRAHVFLGQRFTYDIDPQQRHTAKAITFFYELSTCDLYLISAVTNGYLRPRDYLSLSFGLKLQLF